MKFLIRFALMFIAHAAAIVLAAQWVPGFSLTGGIPGAIPAAFGLTVLYTFVRPLLKFVLSPLIVLTVGLFTLIINASLLYAVDIFSDSIMISGLTPLLLATLVVTTIATAAHVFSRQLTRPTP